MNTRLLTSVLGLALMVTPAWAGTVPTISGKYATNNFQMCQAVQSTANSGSTQQSMSVVGFDSAAGTFHFQGSAVIGGLAVWMGGQKGMLRESLINDGTYSNTETTATFSGVVYSVAYGPVKNGIAQSLVLSGTPTNGTSDCAVSIILSRQ